MMTISSKHIKLLIAAVTLSLGLGLSHEAKADWHGQGDWHDHGGGPGYWHHGWDRGYYAPRPVYLRPPPVYYAPPPPVYYAPPPPVYYYAQPGY